MYWNGHTKEVSLVGGSRKRGTTLSCERFIVSNNNILLSTLKLILWWTYTGSISHRVEAGWIGLTLSPSVFWESLNLKNQNSFS